MNARRNYLLVNVGFLLAALAVCCAPPAGESPVCCFQKRSSASAAITAVRRTRWIGLMNLAFAAAFAAAASAVTAGAIPGLLNTLDR